MPEAKFLSLADLKRKQGRHGSALKSKEAAEAEETVQRQELLASLEELIHTQVELATTCRYYLTPGCEPRRIGIEEELRGVVKDVGLDDASGQPLGHLDLIVDGYRGTWRVLVPDIKSMEVFTTERPWVDVPDYLPWPREVVRHKQAESSVA